MLRTMKGTFSRFIAIAAIVALGVGLLSGLMAMPIDMRTTIDEYFDRQNMHDLRIVSPLGLTDDDVAAIAAVDGVDEVMPAYMTDMFVDAGEKKNIVTRIHSLPTGQIEEKEPENYAFVDGSYNIATKVYGYGGFLMADGKKEVLQGSGSEEEMVSMRNVAGEVLGSMAAIEKAVELGLAELTIYYDYMGIEMWATGVWKRNKKGTIAYYDYIQSIKDKITLHFVKVKGHSGVEGNEEADRLAKEAVGIEI